MKKELRALIDPVTTEEMEEFSTKKNRIPYVSFPTRLPTFDKYPLPPDEHKHIGLYENKQTLYLLIAWTYNTIMERLDKIDKSVEKR